MNTIDDLRATLAGHAELHDDYLTDRVRAVNGRVRTVRRRRVAAVGGTAAVVLAGAVAGVAIVDRPDPSNANLLVGAPVPSTLVSVGYTYDFVAGEESRGLEDGVHSLRVRVPEADDPRLVSWATEGDAQRVSVDGKWSDPIVSTRPDFTDFVVVPAGEAGWVEVSGGTRVALATYELADEPAAGYTKEGVTFRQQRAGAELVGAVVGDRGETSVSLTVTLPEGRLFVADLCQASTTDDLGNAPWATQTLNGEDAGAGSCQGVDPGAVDAGGSGWSPLTEGLVTDAGRLGAGDEVTLDLTLTDDQRGARPIDDPQALLGMAVYALSDEGQRVAGNWVEPVVEHDGHTWALIAVEETAIPAGDWSVPVPSSEERILVGLAQRLRSGTVSTTVDGEPWGIVRGPGTGAGLDGTLPEDAEQVGLRASEGAEGEAAVAFYELVE